MHGSFNLQSVQDFYALHNAAAPEFREGELFNFSNTAKSVEKPKKVSVKKKVSHAEQKLEKAEKLLEMAESLYKYDPSDENYERLNLAEKLLSYTEQIHSKELQQVEQELQYSECYDTLDFRRCVRADGTAYGTRGRCRQGEERNAPAPAAPATPARRTRTRTQSAPAPAAPATPARRTRTRTQSAPAPQKQAKPTPTPAPKEQPYQVRDRKGERGLGLRARIGRKLLGSPEILSGKDKRKKKKQREFVKTLENNLPKGVKLQGGTELTLSTKTKGGDTIDMTFSFKDGLDFKVNGSFAAGSVTSRERQVQVGLAVRGMYDAIVKSLPVGAVISTTAYSKDGKGQDREDAYAKMGFSRPTERNIRMYAKKVDGKTMAPASLTDAVRQEEADYENPGSVLFFSETNLELWVQAIFGKTSRKTDAMDFTRCVRPDGSAYGTRGKCVKGVESEEETFVINELSKMLPKGEKIVSSSGKVRLAEGPR